MVSGFRTKYQKTGNRIEACQWIVARPQHLSCFTPQNGVKHDKIIFHEFFCVCNVFSFSPISLYLSLSLSPVSLSLFLPVSLSFSTVFVSLSPLYLSLSFSLSLYLSFSLTRSSLSIFLSPIPLSLFLYFHPCRLPLLLPLMFPFL